MNWWIRNWKRDVLLVFTHNFKGIVISFHFIIYSLLQLMFTLVSLLKSFFLVRTCFQRSLRSHWFELSWSLFHFALFCFVLDLALNNCLIMWIYSTFSLRTSWVVFLFSWFFIFALFFKQPIYNYLSNFFLYFLSFQHVSDLTLNITSF